ncbi:MAG: phosphoserine phosphatase SerB [Pseudomonadota bacterium]|nr:phosphoserine phosphatase SerB [Pseudomonadota bacterium]
MDLVVQALEIDADALARIADLAHARAIRVLERSGPEAYRLMDATDGQSLREACVQARVDHAFVDPGMRLHDVRVVAMDMDSTLITIECIDEIADMIGIKPQVAAITASAMRGEIDFPTSLTRRVALLAGLPVESLQRVYDERLQLSHGARRMLQGFKAVGARTLLVSGGFTFFTDRLVERLPLDEALANVLEIVDGRLTGRVGEPIVDAAAKAERLAALRDRFAGAQGITVAIGDGANDLPMLDIADVSIAYHAKPVVRARTRYALDHCGLDAALNLFA